MWEREPLAMAKLGEGLEGVLGRVHYIGLSEYDKEPPYFISIPAGRWGKFDWINILFLQVLMFVFEVEQIVKNPK